MTTPEIAALLFGTIAALWLTAPQDELTRHNP